MVITRANLFSCELGGRYWGGRHVETIYSGFWFRESKATDVNVADGLLFIGLVVGLRIANR